MVYGLDQGWLFPSFGPMHALHENWFFPSSDVKIFQLMSALVMSLDGKKPVFHAARALGQNLGIANLVILVTLVLGTCA